MPFLTIFLVAVLSVPAAAPFAARQPAAAPVLVQMSYFAKPGREAEVLELRLRAAVVLEKTGVGRGRVWKGIESPRATQSEAPTVIWEGEFASDAALNAYEQVADNHPDFIAIRRQMTDATVRVERRYFREAR